MFDEGGDLGADEGEVIQVVYGVRGFVEAIVNIDDPVNTGWCDNGGGHCGSQLLDVGNGGVGGAVEVQNVWNEQIALVLDGAAGNVVAYDFFQTHGLAAAGLATMAGKGASGGFPQAGPNVISVKLLH